MIHCGPFICEQHEEEEEEEEEEDIPCYQYGPWAKILSSCVHFVFCIVFLWASTK